MITISVDVTADDIAQGCVGSSENCPIARAWLRALRPLRLDARVSVSRRTMGLWAGHNPDALESAAILLRDTPARARRFILAFDAGQPVRPFKFNLRFGIESR